MTSAKPPGLSWTSAAFLLLLPIASAAAAIASAVEAGASTAERRHAEQHQQPQKTYRLYVCNRRGETRPGDNRERDKEEERDVAWGSNSISIGSGLNRKETTQLTACSCASAAAQRNSSNRPSGDS
ncbi:hypothetical protein T492DRAFT_847569 [Pavlovales sp. CCMP2436]|nr:hypothetical protein T492DRAFT_847569 [Pavlovales sp. CCMP2436]